MNMPERIPDDGAPPLMRSPAQLVRLENEWRRLQWMFAYHPSIRISPLVGDPPDQYQVDYQVRTLVLDAAGQLQYADGCSVHIWLPPDFPHEPPLVRPISPLFHPNVTTEGIAIGRVWTSPANTLVEVVSWVGTILAWQDYDADAALNPVAMDWLATNAQLLPIDPNAILNTEAGGDALSRICRFGPRTLEQIRSQLKQMCDSLLAADAVPTGDEMRSFVQRTRQALSLFLEGNVPDALRLFASELDDFARELLVSAPTWEAIRRHRALADRAMLIARQLQDIEQSVEHEAQSITALGDFDPAPQPLKLIRQIPPVSKLQLHQGNLVNLIARAEQLLTDSRSVLDDQVRLPPIDVAVFVSALQKRLETERKRALDAGADSRKKLNIAIAHHQPSRTTARNYAQAVHRCIDWRAYADLVDRGQQIARRLLAAGPGGVQRVFIELDSTRGGPYDLEQTIRLGERTIAVRNPVGTAIEVIAADTGAVLCRSDSGTAAIPPPEGGKSGRATALLAGNCEEFAIQLDYLLRESSQLLDQLGPPVAGPQSWPGKVAELLGADEAMAAIRAEHEQIARRWAALRDDLHTLAPYRERMLTLGMVQRISEAAAKMAAELAAEEAAMKSSTARIAAIVAASNRDIETGQLHIPAKYAREYPQQLRCREQARVRIPQLRAMIEQAIRDVAFRMNEPRLRGFADRPVLAVLGNLPEEWAEIEPHMSDGALAGMLANLEKHLGAKLVPEGFGAGEAMVIPPAAAEAPPPPEVIGAPPESPAPTPGGQESDFHIVETDEPEAGGEPEEMIDFGPDVEGRQGM